LEKVVSLDVSVPQTFLFGGLLENKLVNITILYIFFNIII